MGIEVVTFEEFNARGGVVSPHLIPPREAMNAAFTTAVLEERGLPAATLRTFARDLSQVTLELRVPSKQAYIVMRRMTISDELSTDEIVSILEAHVNGMIDRAMELPENVLKREMEASANEDRKGQVNL
ncbi:MAG: hypothetical protein JST59_23760 [Actinobacteria bacterium]|nr:hypothetical protein [Actinomycetota bacterium]